MTSRESKRDMAEKLLEKIGLEHAVNAVDESGASHISGYDFSDIHGNSIVTIHKSPPSVTINGTVLAETSKYKVVRYNSYLAIYGNKIEPTVIDLEDLHT